MNFIICDIIGPGEANFGLGNQLFNVATAISLAKDSDRIATFPCLDDKKKYGNYKENLFKNLNTFSPLSNDNFVLYQEQNFSYKKIPIFENNLLLKGYFQSEKYFKHNKKLILDIIYYGNNEILAELRNKYKNLLKLNNIVSVHVRRGDYLKYSNVHKDLMNTDYYVKCFKYLGLKNNFVFFSDDIEWCKKNFNYLENKYFIKEPEDYKELFLMSLFKKNIIANSTFSWWAAWLNDNQDKIILCPQQWFDKDGPKKWDDLYCEGWLKI